MTNKPAIDAFSFCLKDEEVPHLQITHEGLFKVHGRVVTKDKEIYHALVDYLKAATDQIHGAQWNSVEEVGHPEEDTPVWYYYEDTGVNYGKYDGDNTYIGHGEFLCNEVTHWMKAPEAPVRYMNSEVDESAEK